jgi:hypothetical protein
MSCDYTSNSGQLRAILTIQVPFWLKVRAVAKVSSMNWKYTIFPLRTFAWIENGEVTALPSETERYVNLPNTATFSPSPKRSVTAKSSIVHHFATRENVSMNAWGPLEVPVQGKI